MDVNPSWEKFSGESSKAFSAFIVYRNLPPRSRSLAKAVQELYGEIIPSKLRQWEKWSSAFSWVKRCDDWDLFQDRALREQQQVDLKNMQERHIKIANAITQKALERLKDLQAIELTVGDALQWLEAGIKLERLARGQPELLIEQKSLMLSIGADLTTPQLRDLLRERLRAINAQDTTVSSTRRTADQENDDDEDNYQGVYEDEEDYEEEDKNAFVNGKYKNL